MTPLEPTSPLASGDPLPLSENWDLSRSLWESVTDWPAAPSSSADETSRNRPILSPHLDVDAWPAPVLFPPPAADIDLSSALPSDESPLPAAAP
jgi:hypothetical protein